MWTVFKRFQTFRLLFFLKNYCSSRSRVAFSPMNCKIWLLRWAVPNSIPQLLRMELRYNFLRVKREFVTYWHNDITGARLNLLMNIKNVFFFWNLTISIIQRRFWKELNLYVKDCGHLILIGLLFIVPDDGQEGSEPEHFDQHVPGFVGPGQVGQQPPNFDDWRYAVHFAYHHSNFTTRQRSALQYRGEAIDTARCQRHDQLQSHLPSGEDQRRRLSLRFRAVSVIWSFVHISATRLCMCWLIGVTKISIKLSTFPISPSFWMFIGYVQGSMNIKTNCPYIQHILQKKSAT